MLHRSAEAALGLPGRHQFFGGHIGQVRSPLASVFVSLERERANLAFAVALLAILLNDSGNFPGVCRNRLCDNLFEFRHGATDGGCQGNGDRLTGCDGCQGVFEFMLTGVGVTFLASCKLIVDSALITDLARFINDKNFRSDLGSELAHELAGWIVQDREIPAEFFRMCQNLLFGQVRIDTDSNQSDFIFRKSFTQFAQRIAVSICNWALCGIKDHGQSLAGFRF